MRHLTFSIKNLFAAVIILMSCLQPVAHSTPIPEVAKPSFKVLVLAEDGGHHLKFTEAAKPWLEQLAVRYNFTVDYIKNVNRVDERFLNQYNVFIQLDFPPYAWNEQAKKAFEKFMQKGNGGWIGFHHATLLGEFDGYPMWDWFSKFMGGIRWKNYIGTFATATVTAEDTLHPCMKGVSPSFIIEREEWYTYDKSPRDKVHVIARVEESTYNPDSDIKMGDHPVVWSNREMKTRNIYIFMGHSPDLFSNENYTTLFRNAILWAAGRRIN
jgi:type 1 glutamine amidotransferase